MIGVEVDDFIEASCDEYSLVIVDGSDVSLMTVDDSAECIHLLKVI